LMRQTAGPMFGRLSFLLPVIIEQKLSSPLDT
jgi:hypothetical protein